MMGQNTPILQLSLFSWFPGASVTHNVCEEKVKNGQPTPYNVFPTVPSALINITAAGISSLGFGDQYAAVTHNIHEEKMNNGQPAPHTVCSTAPPGLDATVTQNVHEQKMENGQPQTDKVLSTVPLCLGHMTAAGIPSMSIRDLYATVTHNINEERMKNGQPQPGNVLSTDSTGLCNMVATAIPAMSPRDRYMSAYKLYCPTCFSYACIVPSEGKQVVFLYYIF
uniref:sarcoma antigen 1-like isoform X7 n=1 Tax=Callithrix jacchus TaxID=9483 RepID=UPI0023DD2D27|nr:sarcoma antigen 1-like isoform X7 [Callithrix jacchus]